MNDREKWRERVRDIRAGGTTWWWWSIYVNIFLSRFVCLFLSLSLSLYIYIYICVCVCVCVRTAYPLSQRNLLPVFSSVRSSVNFRETDCHQEPWTLCLRSLDLNVYSLSLILSTLYLLIYIYIYIYWKRERGRERREREKIPWRNDRLRPRSEWVRTQVALLRSLSE